MRKKLFIYMFSLLLPGALVFASQSDRLQQGDFTFSATLNSATSSLQELPLDANILQHMQTRTVSDIRVFDANGQIMPALVRRTEKRVEASEHVLNFFPLYGDENKDVQIHDTDVERDASGQVKAIHSRQGQADKKKILTGYIIDQSAYQNDHLSELEFAWQNDNQQVMISMRIETSNDLTNWSVLQPAAVIAHFQIDDEVMRRNVITLSANAQRYLRLTLLTPVENFSLEKITARYNRPGQTDYSWLSLGQPKPMTVNGREQYEFVLPGRVVPALVKFSFSGNNFVIPGRTNGLISGRLFSLTAQHKWVARQTITQYKMLLKQGELKSDPIRLASSRDRRWRFEPADGRKLLASNIPEIKLAYPKYELIFMAQGKAPFTVAWGNVDADRQSSSLSAVLGATQAGDIAEVHVLQATQLGKLPGVDDENTVNWRKWLLFAVLLAAVLAAGRMAYQLFREMNA
jgi:hypothetical protein